jgi:hypothetical protein
MQNRLNKLFTFCLLAGLVAGSTATLAAEDGKTKQENKFGECSHTAKMKGLKGDDFKSFMKSCASAGGSPTDTKTEGKPLTQQDKMKVCNGKAKGMTGDARKTFMKSCLSG